MTVNPQDVERAAQTVEDLQRWWNNAQSLVREGQEGARTAVEVAEGVNGAAETVSSLTQNFNGQGIWDWISGKWNDQVAEKGGLGLALSIGAAALAVWGGNKFKAPFLVIAPLAFMAFIVAGPAFKDLPAVVKGGGSPRDPDAAQRNFLIAQGVEGVAPEPS